MENLLRKTRTRTIRSEGNAVHAITAGLGVTAHATQYNAHRQVMGIHPRYHYEFKDLFVTFGTQSNIAADTELAMLVDIGSSKLRYEGDEDNDTVLFFDFQYWNVYNTPTTVVDQTTRQYIEHLNFGYKQDDQDDSYNYISVNMKAGQTITALYRIKINYDYWYEMKLLKDDFTEYDLDSIWEDQHDVSGDDI